VETNSSPEIIEIWWWYTCTYSIIIGYSLTLSVSFVSDNNVIQFNILIKTGTQRLVTLLTKIIIWDLVTICSWHGPRGAIDNARPILTEPLQGDKWWEYSNWVLKYNNSLPSSTHHLFFQRRTPTTLCKIY